MRKILLTGGAGFIGSNLTKILLERGDFVLVVDNFNNSYNSSYKENNIKDFLEHKNCKLFKNDFRYFNEMEKIFSDYKPEFVIHLGARAGVQGSLKEPQEYCEVNVTGTVNLLELAVKYKITKFIFASSSSVYGRSPNIPFKEDDKDLMPLSPYAVSKLAGENYCRVYSELYKLPVVALRFFTVYGERQRPDLSIFKFTRAIDNGEIIELYGDGTVKRDFTFVMDTLDGLLKSMDYDKSLFEIFNLGESKSYSLNDMIAILEGYIGKKAKIKYLDMLPFDVKATHANIDKARSLLGYTPKTDLKDGLKVLVDWYKKVY